MAWEKPREDTSRLRVSALCRAPEPRASLVPGVEALGPVLAAQVYNPSGRRMSPRD